ncbi:pyocin knob domain-containing protein [Pseudomonas sp. R26(2017)]|uniref:pyocin knob domain-containing protein n=1 Tax=Pseudomonas sp. R26(2017) TaxID=1981695 RepID=UPI000A1E47B2|nr:pyocin knob domain-containing protein [Pseudomonas sp. R26(2017)]
MARKNIELGVIPTGQGGDTFRSAMTKVNDMTQELYDKTAGSQPGATKNRPDAELLARANHTGTQVASTISDFSTTVKSLLQQYGLADQVKDIPEVQLNGLTVNSFVYVSPDGTGSLPFQTSTFYVIHLANSNTAYGVQIAVGGGAGKQYSRTKINGTWAKWNSGLDVGDFGVGATSLLACNDANNVAASGDLLVHPGTLNGPNPGVYGTIKTTFYEKSSSNWTQLILSTTGNKMFYRGCINGGIQPWMQVNEESITNSNGTAVKFSDGTMICWKESSTIQTTSNQVSTGVFLGAAEIFTFPVPFVTIGVVIPSVSYSAYAYCWGSVGEGNNPNQCRVVGFSHAANAQYQARYLAVGRWR